MVGRSNTTSDDNLTISQHRYRNPQAWATRTMRNTPRFGHTDQFSIIFANETTTSVASNGDAEDYIQGLLFIGLFIVSFMMLWLLLLMIFRCCGPKLVGFLSGAPMQKKSQVVDFNRPFRVRVAFVNAVVVFLVFAVLLVVNGISNLQDTTFAVSNTNQEVKALLLDANVVTGNLQTVGRSTTAIRDALVADLGNFCPNDPNIADSTGQDLDKMAQDAIALLEQLGDFINNDVARAQQGIDATLETTQDVEDFINDADVNDWQSLLVLIPYILIPSFLLVGVIMAWCDASIGVFTCLLSWFMMPLFILLTILSIVACAAISAGAVTNADFCSGGESQTPDGTILDILNSQDLKEDDIAFQAVTYYVGQCTATNPWTFIQDYKGQIVDAEDTLGQLQDAFDAITIPRLNLLCGRDFAPLEALLGDMDGNLKVLDTSATTALNLLSCERVLPIYTSAVYGATCDHSITGVTWTFASLLVLAVTGMVMITLRSAYLDVEDEYVMGEVDMYEPREDAYPQDVEFSNERKTIDPDEPEQAMQRTASNDGVERVYIDEGNNNDNDNEQPTDPYTARAY